MNRRGNIQCFHVDSLFVEAELFQMDTKSLELIIAGIRFDRSAR